MHVKAKRVCPHGGVLSLVLWCLMVDGLIKIHLHGAYCIGYTDDIVIINRSKFENILLDILNNIR